MLETQPVSEISEAELLQCLEDEGQSEKPQKQDKTSLRELSTLLDNFYYSVYFKEGRRLDSLKSLLYLRGQVLGQSSDFNAIAQRVCEWIQFEGKTQMSLAFGQAVAVFSAQLRLHFFIGLLEHLPCFEAVMRTKNCTEMSYHLVETLVRGLLANDGNSLKLYSLVRENNRFVELGSPEETMVFNDIFVGVEEPSIREIFRHFTQKMGNMLHKITCQYLSLLPVLYQKATRKEYQDFLR